MPTDPTGYISIPPDLIRGVSWKQPARMASTGNLTLSGLQTVDGVVGADGNRVLVKDNTTGSQNGLWIMHSGAWVRAFDMDQDLTTAVPAEEVAGAFVYVIAGTVNAGKVFHTTNVGGGTLGTTAVVLVEFTTASPLTIKDEGTPLATDATSIDFVGAGVTASGTGAGKTVTIPATVSSVALTVPAEFSVSGSPVTGSGTLAITKANESANTVWAGPTTGSAAAPAFRALVAADIPAGVGAIHELLISDTPSTPLVFADLIQNEAQDDLVYQD